MTGKETETSPAAALSHLYHNVISKCFGVPNFSLRNLAIRVMRISIEL